MIVSAKNSAFDFLHCVIANNDGPQNAFFRGAPIVWLMRESSENDKRQPLRTSINLKSRRIFISACEEGSIAGAAEREAFTASAISKMGDRDRSGSGHAHAHATVTQGHSDGCC